MRDDAEMMADWKHIVSNLEAIKTIFVFYKYQKKGREQAHDRV